MAFTNSALAKAQALLMANFANSELRYREPATFKAFVANSEVMMPSHKLLRTREDRTVEAYFANRSSRSLGSARSHNHSGNTGSSGVLTPSWVTKTDKFGITLKQGDNNFMDHAMQLQSEFQNVIANMAEGLESAAVAHLFANRSQVNGVTAEGSFDGVNYAFEVTESTNGNRFLQIIRSTMDILKYAGGITIFCDTIAYNKFSYLAAQGQGNSVNYSFQFQNVTFVHSIDLNTDASGLSYTKGFCIAVPNGTIGCLDWIPLQNRQGIETKLQSYGSMINPVDGLLYAVHGYETALDGTSTGGYTQDEKSQIEVSIDIALEHAPLSTANETTLQAFALI